VDQVGAVRDLLRSIRYAETRIAVHGDRRLMPRNPRDWSVLNVRFDPSWSAATMWKAWTARGVFRSWVTREPHLPEPLYALRTYQHVLPDPGYFRAQRALAALQGEDGLWLAGVYTHDVDCHESAIASAVSVARRLARDAPNLRRLVAERS
jgi:predicted NAD/FAD-binding protein